jgi:hypothetical protein
MDAELGAGRERQAAPVCVRRFALEKAIEAPRDEGAVARRSDEQVEHVSGHGREERGRTIEHVALERMPRWHFKKDRAQGHNLLIFRHLKRAHGTGSLTFSRSSGRTRSDMPSRSDLDCVGCAIGVGSLASAPQDFRNSEDPR